MSEEERKSIANYVKEVFLYEHEASTLILARLLLLCELLIEKGIINDYDVYKKLSNKNVLEMMKELEYGDDDWDETGINL